jgi:hypothetical protein
MMLPVVVSLLVSAASPVEAPSPAIFSRAEPSIEAGARALKAGDADQALERFRKAKAESADERAIVEYDVGSALLLQALKNGEAAAQQQQQQQKPPAQPGQPAADPQAQGPQLDASALDDARASFERAYGLAKDPRIKSEAALAAGNTAATKQDLDEAIAQYRKSLVADPHNERAKKNLKRALEAKRAQPPPPPQQGGSDDDKKNDDKKNDDKKDDQNKDQKNDDKKDQNKDQKNGQSGDKPKDDDKKGDQQKQDGSKDDQDKQDQQKQDQQKQDGSDKSDDKTGQKGAEQEQPQTAQQKAKKQKRDEARRLLDALRSRERPLTPMEMRGDQKRQPAKNGKDW